MTRTFRALSVALGALGAAALAVAPANAQQLLRDAEIEEFIEDYSFPIFRAAGLPAEEINIWLIGDPTPNAFAGGLNMGIHTGLITMADTPNQIEGVIAHEAGHIAGGHTARSGDMAAAATRPMLLSLVLAAGAIAAGAPEAGIGLLGLGQNIGMANALKYSRGQESAADQAAISFLNGVGHSSQGLIEFFGKLRNTQVITGYSVNPYLQSHPLANQRITALQERASASEFFEKPDTEEEIFRLRMIQAKIYGFLDDANATLRRYPLSDQSPPAKYARAVAYYRSAMIDRAQQEIDALLELEPQNQYFHELKGQMLFEFGQVAASIPAHRQSVTLDPTEPLLRINLGRALLGTEDTAMAQEAIDSFRAALLIEPDNSFVWFELARAYGALNNEPMAYLATAESKYHAGAKAEATQFARRALAGLMKGTPEWRQAADIVFAIEGKDPTATEGRSDPKSRKRAPDQAPTSPKNERPDVPDPVVN